MTPESHNEDSLPIMRARAFAVVLGGVVVVGGSYGWGLPGLRAAAMGTALSLMNVWALERLVTRATRRVLADGAEAATRGLQAALGAKTVVLLTLVALLAGRAKGATSTPFTLGLLVSVFALLAGGIQTALRNRASDQ